jgi:hypothetical protein
MQTNVENTQPQQIHIKENCFFKQNAFLPIRNNKHENKIQIITNNCSTEAIAKALLQASPRGMGFALSRF